MQRVTEYLAEDHRRIEALVGCDWEGFRGALLRHIAIEEKLLFPLVRDVPGIDQLHRDHAEIARLLAPAPDTRRVVALVRLLVAHDRKEEGEIYAACELALGEAASCALAIRAREWGEVRLAPPRAVRS